ncbi:hypothetical protein [Methanobacterium sp. SMA-27]|uniref:hypothetical protein n=1 Tax=Methanobacterium sp. SMA-27 TaxID=1495336 RepID=UPI00064FC18B|nr:hypothetical protein [Methanobacterium sp. SMA-27]
MAEEKVEKFEMRIPPGVTGQIIANVMENYNLEVKQTDAGPVFQGEIKNLEDARDYIVKALNERIQELEKDNIKEK